MGMNHQFDETELLARVNAVVGPYGGEATEMGPKSVGVVGDGRAYLPVVIVTFPRYMSLEQVGRLATRTINEVPGVSRVLCHVHPELFPVPIRRVGPPEPMPRWIERIIDDATQRLSCIKPIPLPLFLDPKRI